MSDLIRCHTHKPSPYLEKFWMKMVRAVRPDLHLEGTTRHYQQEVLRDAALRVVDVGGGNGRNLTFLQDVGFRYCVLLDKAGDYGVRWDIVEHAMPLAHAFADIVLVNYVLMLLPDDAAVEVAVRDLKRITRPGGCVMVEVQWLPNQACLVHTPKQAEKFVKGLAESFGWPMLHESKYRFIAQKPK